MEQLIQFAPILLVVVVFYLVVFLPENKRRKNYKIMLDSLKVNDEVSTRGGIIGKVITIEDDYIILQTGPERTRIKINKNGVSDIINSRDEETEDTEKKKDDTKNSNLK